MANNIISDFPKRAFSNSFKYKPIYPKENQPAYQVRDDGGGYGVHFTEQNQYER
jgi:hypothetical protein